MLIDWRRRCPYCAEEDHKPHRATCPTRIKVRVVIDPLAALEQIADIADGSTTANSLQHIAQIARRALASHR
jgi:hypothetical protein